MLQVRTIILLTLFTMLLHSAADGQELNAKWSSMIELGGKDKGFFRQFIGKNDQFVYIRLTSMSGVAGKLDERIISVSRETLKPKGKAVLRGFGKEKDKKMDGLLYHSSLVFDSTVYVFWTKRVKDTEELYAQSFSESLKKIGTLKRIGVVKGKSSIYSTASRFFVLGNPKAGNQIIVGYEIAKKAGDIVQVECRVMSEDLTMTDMVSFDLPVKSNGPRWTKFFGLTSRYSMADNGKIVAHTSAIDELEEGEKRSETDKFSILTIADPITGSYTALPLRVEGKHLFEMYSTIDEDMIHFSGEYSDLSIDPEGLKGHGFVFFDMNLTTLDIHNLSYQPFPEGFADEIDQMVRTATKVKSSFSKKKMEEQKEARLSHLVVEQIQDTPDGGQIILCTAVGSYIKSYTNSNGSSSSVVVYDKNGVIAVRVDANRSIMWTSLLPRKASYYSNFPRDIKMMSAGDDQYVVTYKSETTDSGGENGKMQKKKSSNIRKTGFEYALLNTNDGTFSRKELMLNGPETPKEQLKDINVSSLMFDDDKIYCLSTTYKRKPAVVAASILTIPFLWPPVLLLTSRKGYFFYGYVGELSVE